MSKKAAVVALALSVVLAGSSAVMSATKSTKKPAAKPKPPVKRVVQGTKQFSGDQAVPGQTYTLGKDYPMNFILNSAEYSTSRLRIGENNFIPTAEQKFLILHFTFHNPQKDEALVRYDTFWFTAVDDTNTNREFTQVVGNESTKQDLSMNLKPGQRVDAYTYIAVPAKATVPKLIVKSGDDLVLRYDMKGKIKPLSGPLADPEDKDGVKALSSIQAKVGEWYQLGMFDLKVEGAAYTDKVFEDQELEEGGRNLIVTATVKNGSEQEQLFRYDTFGVQITDQDGGDIQWDQKVLGATRDKDFSSNVGPGKEAKVRYIFALPAETDANTVTFTEGDENRTFVYDVSGTK